jgi:hypothetical protein
MSHLSALTHKKVDLLLLMGFVLLTSSIFVR